MQSCPELFKSLLSTIATQLIYSDQRGGIWYFQKCLHSLLAVNEFIESNSTYELLMACLRDNLHEQAKADRASNEVNWVV